MLPPLAPPRRLAELGCCCFCSILYIANKPFLAAHPEKARAFMRAIKRATDYLFSDPRGAWAEYQLFKKTMRSPVNERIFERSFVYMSRDCGNVPRDWKKVTNYCKRLGVVSPDFEPNMTNEFLGWELEAQPEEGSDLPQRKQEAIKLYQEEVARGEEGILKSGVAPNVPGVPVRA